MEKEQNRKAIILNQTGDKLKGNEKEQGNTRSKIEKLLTNIEKLKVDAKKGE